MMLGCYAWTLVVDSELRERPPVILAIREHRGALRIDFAASAPWCEAMARLAATEALLVCEVCGEPGTWSEAGQGQVRCKGHRRPRRIDYLNLMSGTLCSLWTSRGFYSLSGQTTRELTDVAIVLRSTTLRVVNVYWPPSGVARFLRAARIILE